MTFTLRCPKSENPHLRSEAEILSRHHSLAAARRALTKYQSATEQQGFGCEAYIWNDDQNRMVTPTELATWS